MSDTVTLIAGILLISVGLLSLLPYALKRGWRLGVKETAADGRAALALVATDTSLEDRAAEAPGPDEAEPDMEALLTNLFSLRLTVSDVTVEVHEAHETLGKAARSGEAAGFLEEPA